MDSEGAGQSGVVMFANIHVSQPTSLVAHTVALANSVDGSTILLGLVVVVPAFDTYVRTYPGAASVHAASHWTHQCRCDPVAERQLAATHPGRPFAVSFCLLVVQRSTHSAAESADFTYAGSWSLLLS